MAGEPTPSMQEYLTAIYKRSGTGWARTTDIAHDLNATPASVTEAFKRLARDGFIEYVPYRGVRLTEKGLQVAEAVARRESMLREAFVAMGLDPAEADRLACLLEHSISDEGARRVYEFARRCGGGASG